MQMDFFKAVSSILIFVCVVESNKTNVEEKKNNKIEKRSISPYAYDDAYRVPVHESTEYLPLAKFKVPKSRYLMSELSDHNYKEYDFLPSTSQVYYKEPQNYQVVIKPGQTDVGRQQNFGFEYFSDGPQKKARQVSYDFDDNKSSDFQTYVLNQTPKDSFAKKHHVHSDKPSYKEDKTYETDYLYTNKKEPTESTKLNSYLFYGHPLGESKEDFRSRLERQEDFFDYKPSAATLRYASEEKVDFNDYSFLNKMAEKKVEGETEDEYLSYFLPKSEEPVKFNEHPEIYEKNGDISSSLLHIPNYDKDDIDRTFKFNVKGLLRNQYIHLLGNRYPKHMYEPPDHSEIKYPYHPHHNTHNPHQSHNTELGSKYMHGDHAMNDLYDYNYMPKVKETEQEMVYVPKHHDYDSGYGNDLKVTPYKMKYQPQVPNYEYKPEVHPTKTMSAEYIYNQPDYAKQLTLKYLPELLETLKLNEIEEMNKQESNKIKEMLKEIKMKPSPGYDLEEHLVWPDKSTDIKVMPKVKHPSLVYLPESSQDLYDGRNIKQKLPEIPKPQYQTADQFKYFNDELIMGKKIPNTIDTVMIPTKPSLPTRIKTEIDENYYNDQFMKALYEQDNSYNYVKSKPYMTLMTPEKEIKTTVIPEIIYFNYPKNHTKEEPQKHIVYKQAPPKKEETTKANIFAPSNSNEALEWFKKNYPNLFSLDEEFKEKSKQPKQNSIKDSEEDKTKAPHRYGFYKNMEPIEYIRHPEYPKENGNAEKIIIIKKPKQEVEGEQKFLYANDLTFGQKEQNREQPKKFLFEHNEENNGNFTGEYPRRFAAAATAKEPDNAYKKFKILENDKGGSFFFSGLNGQEFFVNNASRVIIQQDGANGFIRGKHVNAKSHASVDDDGEKRGNSLNQVSHPVQVQVQNENHHESSIQNLENAKSRRRPTNFRGRTKAAYQYNTEKNSDGETLKQYEDQNGDIGKNMNKPEVLSHTLRVNKTIDLDDFLDKNFYDQNNSIKRSFRKTKRTVGNDVKATTTDHVQITQKGGTRA